MAKKYNVAGFYREEIDKSERTVPPGTSTGAIVVRATKGPINRAVLIETDQQYVETFGAPVYTSGCSVSATSPVYTGNDTLCKLTPELGYGAYAAIWFLAESNALYVVRHITSADQYAAASFAVAATSAPTHTSAGIAASTSASNISSPDTSTEIDNIDTWLLGHGQTDFALAVAATGPGTDGNNIGVTVQTYSSATDWAYAYDEPGVGTIAAKVFKLNVYVKADNQSWSDTALAFSAISAKPVETFYGTLIAQLDATGKQLFIEEVVNGISQYVYVKSNVTTANAFTSAVNPTAIVPLLGGAIDATNTTGLADNADSCATDWGFFSSREETDVNVLINCDWAPAVAKTVTDIAALRMDCVACNQVGDLADDTIAKIIAASPTQVVEGPATTINAFTNPSYVGFYAGFDRVYDPYNNRAVYLPKAMFAAMIMARTDNEAYPWSAPAGTEWGILPATAMYRQFTLEELGTLQDKNINSSRFIRGTGHVMWGQKTGQLKKTALDRLNVRRLLIYIENNMEVLFSGFLFRNANTSRTRLRVWTLGDTFLNSVWAGDGIASQEDGMPAYELVCDATNNTAEIINANQLLIDVYMTPAYTIEVIRLRITITKTGISFEEIRAS